jgi:site-specific recombinase XerD
MSEQLIGDLRSYLAARGHTPATLHQYTAAAAHFLGWLGGQPPDRQRIDAQAVRVFLHDHLPACRCPHPGNKQPKSVRAALNQLLAMRGEARVDPPRPLSFPGIEAMVARFDTYLGAVCGLADATRRYRRRFVRDFLVGLFGDGSVDVRRITPEALIGFVTERVRAQRPGSVGVLACSLRSFLRFLQLEGERPADLGGALPTPAHWSLAPLPPSLNEEQRARFWASFDRATALGRRDYAMARCLADLGLRCQEVAALRLDDIDWRSGVLDLSPGKSRRAAQLPLPQATGAALADYLRHARPTTSTRAVFVQHRAPVGAAAAKTTVRGAIRRAFARADLPWTGTHILRHTAAACMVQSGSALKLVADVLRHRSIDTTAIYAKVDLPNLSRVALPWPGRSL